MKNAKAAVDWLKSSWPNKNEVSDYVICVESKDAKNKKVKGNNNGNKGKNSKGKRNDSKGNQVFHA